MDKKHIILNRTIIHKLRTKNLTERKCQKKVSQNNLNFIYFKVLTYTSRFKVFSKSVHIQGLKYF